MWQRGPAIVEHSRIAGCAMRTSAAALATAATSMLFAGALFLAVPVAAQQVEHAYPDTHATFVHLGSGVPGLYYEPQNPGPKAAIAVFVMHASGDYLEMPACAELSERGYRVLCANNTNNKAMESDFDMDRALLDAKLGVEWLRKQANVRKVVLLGHSGGGVLMSAYQAVAEKGLSACNGPEKLAPCASSVAGLPAADGIVLLDANYGISTMTLFSLDPAILDERSGRKIDPSLDLFNPKNGFDPAGSTYGPAFQHRFEAGVARRSQRLVATATARLKLIDAGKGQFRDDEPFIVPGAYYLGGNNKFFAQDTRFLAHTRNAWPLLHQDGSTTTEIVHSVRRPQGMRPLSDSYAEGALRTTVRKYLVSHAIRVGNDFGYDESGIHGVDWTSSYTTPIGNVHNVTVPLLTMGMTAGYEYLAAELIYENSASADKSIAFVEGATHIFLPCAPCGATPDQYGDTKKTLFDHVDQWLAKPGRFLD